MAPTLHRGIGRDVITRVAADQWSHARHNDLLASLPAAVFDRLDHALEPVELFLGHVLWEAGCDAEHVYFPVTDIVSLMQDLASGATAEVAVVGNEGLVGIVLVLGSATTTTRAFVRAAGTGYRLRADVLQREFEECPPLRRILLRYAQLRFTQIAQTAVCRGHHTVEQQVCKILLSTVDRLGSEDLALTQELIAELVGVRRESVTTAAGSLQMAGIIRYHHGRINVLDWPALAQRACECHAAIEGEALRLFARPCPGPSQSAFIPSPRDLAYGVSV